QEPPGPSPNSEVKLLSADGSAGSPRVRVGHCQALMMKARLLNRGGLFYVRIATRKAKVYARLPASPVAGAGNVLHSSPRWLLLVEQVMIIDPRGSNSRRIGFLHVHSVVESLQVIRGQLCRYRIQCCAYGGGDNVSSHNVRNVLCQHQIPVVLQDDPASGIDNALRGKHASDIDITVFQGTHGQRAAGIQRPKGLEG